MPALDPGLRGSLERAVLAAREASEKAGKAALETLAVQRGEPFASLSAEERRLRNALRARARLLGGRLEKGIPLLIEEVAYEQWHRMLFARFLAENGLLMHPSGVSVTIQDCAELAAEEGEPDAWQLAARYASRMLPGIFGLEDPSAQVRFAPEGRLALEGILAGLPSAVFTADDGLGWVYQFWQTKRKKEVSSSGEKIERLDLAAYSQLFTEHYMVQFLLENSLGAWWAARHPDSSLLKEFTYLRFRNSPLPLGEGQGEGRIPAAGTFPGWPDRAAEVTVMDPCCGSGHFLVAAFEMLRRMRIEEEGLSEPQAAEAVLRDNLFGLEIDPRCVQIAAFALALAAWKAGGYRTLPALNLACSGIPVAGQLDEWTRLAGDDANSRHTLEQLYQLFRNAPDLGSLINPADVPVRDRMFAPDFSKVGLLLGRALANGRAPADDPVAAVFGNAARAVARAADLLGRQYSLVATNVPFLGLIRQGEALAQHAKRLYPLSASDLSTVFLERCKELTRLHGCYAIVTPQIWTFQSRGQRLRARLVEGQEFLLLSRLGPRPFRYPIGQNILLSCVANETPSAEHQTGLVDCYTRRGPSENAEGLANASPIFVRQLDWARGHSMITFERTQSASNLGDISDIVRGLSTGETSRFERCFWEVDSLANRWDYIQETTDKTQIYGGRSRIILWEKESGQLAELARSLRHLNHAVQSWRRGKPFWGSCGVAVNTMGTLQCTIYTGEKFSGDVGVIKPRDGRHLSAIWSYCSSDELHRDLRRFNSKLNVEPRYLERVPFDLERWQKVADEMYSNGLPEPYSNDPTQWLFKGDPADSTEPLQVAVARLLGYHWPQQEPDRVNRLVDSDGIIPRPPLAGEEPAHERLRALLAAAFGDAWSPALQERLLTQVGFAGKGLDLWLRDAFFEQHCALFHHRPFIWHIWDGRKDGFSVLVNYHSFDGARLGKLIYTYLGDWIRTQRAAHDAGVAGADGRLVAAIELQKKLEAIRDGEKPLDIYVRWKPPERQSIGWEPDLDDGVRLNIRPFVLAGVLRTRVNVNWNKDRGRNPDGSERINDIHLTLAEKQAARKAAGR